jgi:hypothetical protein
MGFPKLQVMDVGVNGPPKEQVWLHYEEFMVENESKYPKRDNMSKWIKETWDTVTVTSIINNWRSCGLLYNNNNDDDNLSIQSEDLCHKYLLIGISERNTAVAMPLERMLFVFLYVLSDAS